MATPTPTPTAPYRIVVPLDHSQASEQAIPYARALAQAGDAVVLLHVVSLPDISPVLLPKLVSLGSLRHDLHESATAHLDAVVSRIHLPEGVTATAQTVDGLPAEKIIEQAVPAESSIIVMTTTGRGAGGRLAFGSIADRVARTSHVPVLLVRVESDAQIAGKNAIRRIVVPLDGSDRSLRSLPTAAAIAKRLAVPVLLVTVNEAEQLLLAYGTGFTAVAYAEIAANGDEELNRMLGTAAEQLHTQGIRTDRQILTGAPVPAIESVLEPGDIIVMASHGRSGIRRWLLGSVAERLIRTGPAPVMLVPSM